MKNGDRWKKIPPERIAEFFGTDLSRGLEPGKASARRKSGISSLFYIGGPFMYFRTDMIFSAIGAVFMLIAALSAYAFGRCGDMRFIVASIAVGALLCIGSYMAAGIMCRRHAEKWIPVCKVVRGGEVVQVRGDRLVLGDIVVLSAGDTVCADMRLFGSGEIAVSFVDDKKVRRTERRAAVNNSPALYSSDISKGGDADRDVVYFGMTVEDGSCRAVVCALDENTSAWGRGGIRLAADSDPVRLKSTKKTGMIWGTAALAFAVISVIAGIISPISRTDFVGLFLIYFSYAASCAGEIIGSLCCIRYVTAMICASRRGVFLRDPSGVDYLTSCDAIAAENTGYMKSGKSKLCALFALGRSIVPGGADGDGLMSLLLVGTERKGKYGAAVMSSAAEHVSGRMELSKFLSAAEMTAQTVEQITEGKLIYTLYVTGGEYYFAVTGEINDVLTNCTKVRTSDGDVKIDRNLLDGILGAAADSAKNASVLLAVAVRKSPYNNLKRLSVLSSDLTFVGFAAIDTPADPNLTSGLSYLASESLPFFFFTDGSGEDVNFARRLGVINSRKDVYPCKDPNAAVSSVLSERSMGGAVLAYSQGEKAALLRTAAKAGKRIAFAGDISFSGNGSFVAGEADLYSGVRGNGALLHTGKGVSALISAVRVCRMAETGFRRAVTYVLASSAVRAVYAFSAVFGMPYVYPSVILAAGLVLDFLVSTAIIAVSLKNRINRNNLYT